MEAYRKEYPTTLGDIEPGRPFFMLNYDGLFMRVHASSNFIMIEGHDGPYPTESRWFFNDRGDHLPIINLTTGSLMHMHKTKPVRVY